MNFRIESGHRLRSARKAKNNMKLRELGDLTGLEPSRISNYEQGSRYMDPDTAKVLARALGVRASWLMAIDDEDTMTPDERTLVQKYRQTDARGRTVIQSIANAQPELTPPPDDHPTTPPFNIPSKRRQVSS